MCDYVLPEPLPDAFQTVIKDATLPVFSAWLDRHLTYTAHELTLDDRLRWWDAFSASPQADRLSGSHAMTIVGGFQTIAQIPVAEAVVWFREDVRASKVRALLDAGFTFAECLDFLEHMGLRGTKYAPDFALKAGPGWMRLNLTPATIRMYVGVGVTAEEAAAEWEPRRAAGENIHAALEMLAALRR